MARDKKLIIGAINITIQPHTPEKYLSLFKDVFKLQFKVPIAGDQYGMLTRLFKLERDQEEPGPITGDIFKFTNIDKNARWVNLETNDFATDDDKVGVTIPDNLKPNSSRFSYIFFPKQHLFFYEGYYDGNSLGASTAEKFVERLFSHELIVKKYGKVEVTHIPDIDNLSDALKIPVKERIEMVIKIPNPDGLANAEKRVLKRMMARNVGKFEEKHIAIKGQSIEMDKELETTAHIAAKNGSLLIKGKDQQSKSIEYSTVKHPFRLPSYYDPDVESAFELFARVANSMKNSITKHFRR